MSNNLTFGSIIHRERQKRGWSLATLAQKIGEEEKNPQTDGKKQQYVINPSYINRLEKSDKVNPGFKVVCQLVQVLQLDIKEVLHSFGFDSLIPNVTRGNYTIEELFRIHDIEHPIKKHHVNKDTLAPAEKELLINIILKAFNLASKPQKNINDLTPLLDLLQELSVNQQENQDYIFEVNANGVTYIVDIQAIQQNDFSDMQMLKDIIREEVIMKIGKLLDISNGIIQFNINNKYWFANVENRKITFLFEANEIVSL